MTAVFACIVQPKVIEFNVSDQKLHRAQKDEELRRELEALRLPPPHAATATVTPDNAPELLPLLTQPGGGCRLLTRSSSVSVASAGSAVCVFEGSLTNATALAEDYAPLPEDEPTPEPAALSNAQLMCHMYAKVGVEMLGLLRGAFTFVLYESKTSRVLAARDGSGKGPLFQARSGSSGGLVLTNSVELLEASGCTDKLEFLPGDYKYGWSATPRRYQPSDHVRLSRRSVDLPASAHHHHHHHHHHYHHQQGNGKGNGNGNGHIHGANGNGGGATPQGGNSRNGSRRNSLDLQHHQNNNNNKGHQHPQDNSPSATATVQDRNGADGRHHNRGHPPQQPPAGGATGAGTAPLSPQQQPAPQPAAASSHPHRTYVVSAEDPRILKASAARHQQQQQQQPKLGDAAPVAAAAGVWMASARAPAAAVAAASGGGGRSKDKVPGQGGQGPEGGNGRGGSARGASAGHHNQRRSMDSHGAWRLGSGQSEPATSPGPIAAAAGAVGRPQAGRGSREGRHGGEQQPQQVVAKEGSLGAQKHPAPKADVAKQQQQQQQQQGAVTPSNGRSRGRSSIDGHNVPGKQQQQQRKQLQQRTSANGQAAKADAAPTSPPIKVNSQGRAGSVLRVDAAEFVCNQTAAAGAPVLGPLAVVSAP